MEIPACWQQCFNSNWQSWNRARPAQLRVRYFLLRRNARSLSDLFVTLDRRQRAAGYLQRRLLNRELFAQGIQPLPLSNARLDALLDDAAQITG